MKALEGFHIRYTIDNCKNKFEIQEVLDSLIKPFFSQSISCND